MHVDENKVLVRRYLEAFHAGNLAAIDELFPAHYIRHIPAYWPEPGRGPEHIRQVISGFRNAFPDLHFTVEDQIAEGETVVTRWTVYGTHKGELRGFARDIPPTGKQVTVTGIIIDRFVGGKFIESWITWDVLGLLQQLGVVRLPEQSAS